MDTPAPGDVLLGKYRVERCLGRGGMGMVVAARHLHLRELYALKFLLPSGLGNAQAVERFAREARAAASLKGEHVARVHDLGTLESGEPYMVMEYIDGSDLKVVLRDKGALPAEEAIVYLLQACQAMAEAHAAGIIHRDIKCSNLFLGVRPDGTPCLKVLDWGVSKHTGANEVELTETSMIIGSPLYMSPEQMTQSKSVDPRTDIWSLGVVLYELLTGRSPFRANASMEVIVRVLYEEPDPPRRLRPELPARLESIVMRCLRKRPEQRFQHVEELAAELREVQAELALAKALGEATTEQVPVTRRSVQASVNVESGGGANAAAMESIGDVPDGTHQRSSVTGTVLATTDILPREERRDRSVIPKLFPMIAALGILAIITITGESTDPSDHAGSPMALKLPRPIVAPPASASASEPEPPQPTAPVVRAPGVQEGPTSPNLPTPSDSGQEQETEKMTAPNPSPPKTSTAVQSEPPPARPRTAPSAAGPPQARKGKPWPGPTLRKPIIADDT